MGPRKRWAAAYLALLLLAYWPLTRWGEPALREAWFRTVTRGLVKDARELALPPPGTLWLGASRPELPQSLYGVYKLEANLGCRLTMTSFYQAWGDGPEHSFPGDILRNLAKGGYVPMVTWEPWLSAFARFGGAEPRASLRLIAAGELDGYLRAWARGAVAYGAPFFLRPGHEPTNPWYAWTPEHGSTAADYRAFWARVHRIFREEGARNVLFVWTPFGLADHDWFPGTDAVDWIGFDIFNYGGLSEQGTWMDFYSLTKLFYDAYRNLAPHLLIAEVGTSSAGGNKTDWIRDMFHTLARDNFPKLRAVVLFDQPAGQTNSGLPVDWSLGESGETFAMLKQRPELLAPYPCAPAKERRP
jgi:cellulose synthase (UDP-forming)